MHGVGQRGRLERLQTVGGWLPLCSLSVNRAQSPPPRRSSLRGWGNGKEAQRAWAEPCLDAGQALPLRHLDAVNELAGFQGGGIWRSLFVVVLIVKVILGVESAIRAGSFAARV